MCGLIAELAGRQMQGSGGEVFYPAEHVVIAVGMKAARQRLQLIVDLIAKYVSTFGNN